MYPEGVGEQVPPFKQGLGWHLSTGGLGAIILTFASTSTRKREKPFKTEDDNGS